MAEARLGPEPPHRHAGENLAADEGAADEDGDELRLLRDDADVADEREREPAAGSNSQGSNP